MTSLRHRLFRERKGTEIQMVVMIALAAIGALLLMAALKEGVLGNFSGAISSAFQ